MMRTTSIWVTLAATVAMTACVKVQHVAVQPTTVPGATLWNDPGDLRGKDLFAGPWGQENAPAPQAVYTFVHEKRAGVNPGMTVRDPQGREWSVKQLTPGGMDREAQVEVALSRILSAIGYHQPAIYYLPSFTLKDDWGTHREVGGRFRLKDEHLKEISDWSWQENPFVGTKPLNGLLVFMMMVNATDLKDSNNSVYERRIGDRVELWYAARDIGAALGDTSRLGPFKSDPDAFDREPYITGVVGGHVKFHYGGFYKGLVDKRVAPDDVAWMSRLLSRLSDEQWKSAFRAGGYQPDVANRFIARMREKIRQGQALPGVVVADSRTR
jgi:hypothetical protein